MAEARRAAAPAAARAASTRRRRRRSARCRARPPRAGRVRPCTVMPLTWAAKSSTRVPSLSVDVLRRSARRRRAPLAGRRDGSSNRARRSGARRRSPSGMRTISRPEPPAITRIACGAMTDGASRSRRPSAISTRVALGESWMPAPVSSSLAACSSTVDAQAGARQRQRRRQPGDAGAGDDDVTRGRQGSELRILDQAAAVSGSAHSAGRAACGSSVGSNR